ncbi:cadherin-18-like [Sinocyclocheilus anshuiensis]|uniref:cadherin-18-like n=1 Tax=Sinocyclocheilus anshuiensis TaxID=1608454 RepID=UPI0007B9E371|nr:PREDICTED: cadherin-18-like [Sinocyclocheilus anshuiensis]
MKVNPSSCLCPVLLCLCFLERGYEASHHGQAKIISRSHNATHNHNQTKDGETEVHHRPKRGWIWNQFFVLEEHIGPDAQYVGKLHSNSDKGDGSVRYILSGEGAGSIFIINEVTGDIHATKSLDREKKSHYVLHAQAINLNTNKPLEPESEFIIKVQDINDNAPKFPDGPFVTTVPEMAEVGTSVFQVTATDADDPTYGNSARVVYSVLHGQPYFSIDPKTGIIRTALADMDREAREHYSVVIQAKDMAGQVGGLSGSTTVNITLTDINDNPPKFPQKNYQVFVPESAQVGKPVGKIKANDEDIGINAEIKYSILNPEGAGMFSISTDKDTREGVITLRKFILGLMFLSLAVKGIKCKILIVISLSRLMQSRTVHIFLWYFIEQREDKEVYFDIESISGVIRTTQLLDREDTPWHNITVMATEEDNPSLQSHVPVTVQVLDVNDNPPMINTEDEIIICESTRAGQVIQTIAAVDKDDFANGKGFSFSFPGGVPANPNFTIKDNEDSTASIIARRRRFHRLTQELYKLPLVVWDDGEPVLSSTSTLTLRVCSCQRGTRLKICQGEAFLSSAGLSTGALIAILLCVLILLAIVILFITLRRNKKEPLIISEEDIRENVVTYDDEGGGEEDTEAFDIIALRNPAAAEELKFRRDVRPECIRPWSSRRAARSRLSPSSLDIDEEMDIGEFIKERVAEADQDTSVPPYDSLQTYAYEGQGSPAGSISSLGSAGAHSDLNYNSLDDWGPKFEKIAELYGEEVETASESTEKAES